MPARTKDLIFVVASVFLVACGGNGNNGGSGDDECESRSCKLTASDMQEFDRFGAAVATSGEVTVVGASFDDDGGLYSGLAYVFRSEGTAWFEEQKLSASDADAFDAFGTSVAFADDVIVVGAPGNAAAYVFRFDGNNWLEEQMLSPIGAGLLFGTSVSISGNAIAVGAPGLDWIRVPIGPEPQYFEPPGWLQAVQDRSSWVALAAIVSCEHSRGHPDCVIAPGSGTSPPR